MRKNLILLLFTLMSGAMFGQSINAGWLELNPDIYLFNNKKWFFTPEFGYRSTNFHGAHQILFRPHVGYKMNKHFSFELGGQYVGSWSDFSMTKHDASLYLHVSMSSGSWHGFSFGLRVRTEEWLSHVCGGSTNYSVRLRVRPHIKYNLPFLKPYSLYLQALVENHTYLVNRDKFNDALWFAGRFGVSPTKRLRLILEYNYALTYKPGNTTYGNRLRLITYYSFL